MKHELAGLRNKQEKKINSSKKSRPHYVAQRATTEITPRNRRTGLRKASKMKGVNYMHSLTTRKGSTQEKKNEDIILKTKRLNSIL